MMARQTEDFCAYAGCERPAYRGDWCDGHEQQMRRFGRMSELEEKPTSPRDRLREAALTYCDSGDDDAAFKRADDNLLRSALSLGRKSWVDAQREGRERARKFGAKFGRKPKVTKAEAQAAMAEHGNNLRLAGKALGISKVSVWRALHQREE